MACYLDINHTRLEKSFSFLYSLVMSCMLQIFLLQQRIRKNWSDQTPHVCIIRPDPAWSNTRNERDADGWRKMSRIWPMPEICPHPQERKKIRMRYFQRSTNNTYLRNSMPIHGKSNDFEAGLKMPYGEAIISAVVWWQRPIMTH